MAYPKEVMFVIVWTKNFPKYKRPMGYLRLLQARLRFFDHFVLKRNGLKLTIKKERGYCYRLRQLYNKYEGKRCFIIGNGPSLKKMDLSPLKDELTIGSNAIYKAFSDWGFSTDFILFEDVEQTEIRGPEIPIIKDSTKLLSLYNAYAVPSVDRDTLFMNVRGADKVYWEEEAPMFSRDFANIIYLGSTVTYLSIQLAHYLGCSKVYLIGVDHSMKELRKQFPPGKVAITEDNFKLLKQYHFSNQYYKVGDCLGIPYYEYQEDAYKKAREVFLEDGREIYNAGLDSQLDVFEKKVFKDLFN